MHVAEADASKTDESPAEGMIGIAGDAEAAALLANQNSAVQVANAAQSRLPVCHRHDPCRTSRPALRPRAALKPGAVSRKLTVISLFSICQVGDAYKCLDPADLGGNPFEKGFPPRPPFPNFLLAAAGLSRRRAAGQTRGGDQRLEKAFQTLITWKQLRKWYGSLVG